MNRIERAFANARAQRRAALMPYLPLGFPSLAVSTELICAAEAAGADMLELGIPFSDPLADGPIIQGATQVALKNGMTVQKSLEMVRQARRQRVNVPLLFMTYYNPILAFGEERFAGEAAAAGADGLIVPDLPPEEAAGLKDACRAAGLDLVFLAAPTSTDDRLARIGAAASGFLYLVSLTGVTGPRESLPAGLDAFAARCRRATSLPVAVGFGIGSAESARQVAGVADGVIVGSALVARMGEPGTAVARASAFIWELRRAVRRDGAGPEIERDIIAK